MQPKRITHVGLEAKPPVAGRFLVIFFEKIAILFPFELHFVRFQSHLKEQNFCDLKAN